MNRIKRNTISKKTIKTNNKEVTVTKLKTKNPRKHHRVRKISTQCPVCMSTLVLGSLSKWECTGDRLSIWVPYFIEYEKLKEVDKISFLKKISDKDRFFELYYKWAYLDKAGERTNFTCGYTPQLHTPVAKLKTSAPNLTLVPVIEKKLGRKLTELELLGEKPVWDGQNLVTIK